VSSNYKHLETKTSSGSHVTIFKDSLNKFKDFIGFLTLHLYKLKQLEAIYFYIYMKLLDFLPVKSKIVDVKGRRNFLLDQTNE